MRERKVFIIVIIFLLLGFGINVHANEYKDSTLHKNSIKLDFFPLYYDFFDYRKQIRTGIEYERYLNNKSFTTINLDFGLFDDYKFMKYYDFFNQSQGIYSIEQTITIKGFHLIPAYNYYLLKSKKNSNQGVFCGVIMDINVYQKKLDYFNSQTFDKTTDKYTQKRLGLGLCLGAKYGFGSHFFTEIKTSILVKVYNVISIKDVNQIKPLNAQWTDAENNFWWVSNFKIGYAFK